MKDSDGNEVALFPMEYLYMSQGEHQLYALDFLGWNANGTEAKRQMVIMDDSMTR